MLQLVRLVERINRSVDENEPRGEPFLDLAKAFDTVCTERLFCKLTILKFPA
jgi:hypothetical protein